MTWKWLNQPPAVSARQFSGFRCDLAMAICGRHVALDYNLSAKSATEAVAALSRCLEKYRRKCANT